MESNLESIVGKKVSFGMLVGSKLTNATGVVKTIQIEPDNASRSALGLKYSTENVVVPSQPGQGKVLGLKVVSGGKRRKTLRKGKSKH
jgi:hypothetical protein